MSEAVLQAKDLVKTYRRDRGPELRPLDGVGLELERGAVEAVVGPSGAGKSTLARCLTLLEPPDAGRLVIDGVKDPWSGPAETLRRLRRRCQLLPQEPGRAVSPRWSVERVVTEPLDALPGNERRERAAELLASAELDVPLGRPARDLSGGQLQRLVIARALACDPVLMVLDETLTGLDLSLRSRIVERLLRWRDELGLTLLLISHDVPLMRHLADRVWRLHEGRLLPLAVVDGADGSGETS